VINYAWRDYGIRVGLWRIADVLDSAGIRATVALNAMVCDVFPKAVEEMKRRGWEFMGHGITNSSTLANVPVSEEREVIRTTLRTIQRATGKRPRGWLGPGLTETFNTLDLLAEEEIVYVGDWNSDDQPFAMKVKKGKLFAVPYGMDINDMSLINRLGYTGEQYLRALTDQFDTLYADSENTARVMGVPLHPFLMGQPWRTPYLKKAISLFKQHERVWVSKGSQIVEAYQKILFLYLAVPKDPFFNLQFYCFPQQTVNFSQLGSRQKGSFHFFPPLLFFHNGLTRLHYPTDIIPFRDRA